MSSVEDQAAFQRKLAELYRLFEASGGGESPASMDGALKELIIDCVALQRDLDASDPSMRRKIWKWASNKMGEWDPNDPALAHSAKMLRLLSANLDGSTTAYAEDLQLHRHREESTRQAKHASNPHRKYRLDEMLGLWVKREPDLGTAEALERLRDREGYGVVIEVTEEDITPSKTLRKSNRLKK